VFAGVSAGASLIDVSVNGLGDRSSNPSLASARDGSYGVKPVRLEALAAVKVRGKISAFVLNKPW
jgi:isopropylmalate/homocitrate/citramalate synthase